MAKKTILSIETSCDETSIALINGDETSITVLSHIVLSQASLHAEFGGVFPNLARREHAKALIPVLKEVLAQAFPELPAKGSTADETRLADALKILHKEPALQSEFSVFATQTEKPPIDAIVVTSGPGLEPALWVGITGAHALGHLWQIPVYAMNHMEGHIAAALLAAQKPDSKTRDLVKLPAPSLAFLLSGGHTQLVLVRGFGHYECIGQTRDDAVGEAYDKTARLMGLAYPGGPKLAALAQEARTFNIPSPLPLPRPMRDTPDFDFSFSGLKTAVRYAIEKISPLTDTDKKGLAKEFEEAVKDVLIIKTHRAIIHHRASSLILGGGVVANEYLRDAFSRLATAHEIPLYLPDLNLATDNALMIAIAALLRLNTNTLVPSEHTVADGTRSL